MNRDKVKVLIISVVIISFTILVFLGGIKLYNNSYSNFKLNGYIIASKNDTKSERYYFNENQKYKKTVNKNVVFETTSKNSVSVLENSFVHYDNNSISTLKKAAILNLDNIDDKTIKYYNLYEGSILNKSNDTYSFTNSGKRTSLKNMIVKISSNKYLIAGADIVLNIAGQKKEFKNNYLEVTFFDGNIIKIENQEESYKNIQDNISIEIGDILINLNNKTISKNGEVKLNLEQITIDSDDNIDISEKENQDIDEDTDDNNTVNEENKKSENDIPNVEKDTIDSYDASEVIVNNQKYKDPIFTIEKLNVGINSIDCSILIEDPDSLLQDNIYINIYDSATSEMVYEFKQSSSLSNINVKLNTLNYNTNYILVVSADYIKGDIKYNKDFIQKTFVTSDLGIDVSKNYITKDSISLNFNKSDYSNVDSFNIKLCDTKNNCIKKSVDTSALDELVFDNLKENSKYTFTISDVSTSASGISTTLEADFDKFEYSTLKNTPSVEKIDVSIDKKNSIFTITPVNVNDKDNAIKSYQYEIYEVVDGELKSESSKKIEKKDNKSFDINVSKDGSSGTLKRNTEYKCFLTIVYNDNTKDIYMDPVYTTLYMGGNEYPVISFEESGLGITHESINGFIKVSDKSHTIRSNLIIVEYSSNSSSISGRIEYSDFNPGDTNINIPINVTGLKSNESYNFKVISNNIELNDVNSVISDNDNVNYVELKNFNLTTKIPNKIKVNVSQNDTLENFFSLNVRFENKQSVELNTLSILRLSFSQLPDFSESNNNELVEIEYKDNNTNIYESSISSCFISNENCFDIPLDANYNITSSKLGLDKFDFHGNIFLKIEGIDYAGNIIEFSIVNGDTDTNTNIFKIITIDSLRAPTNKNDSLMVESITKKNAVLYDNKNYSEKMFDDTFVGFTVYPRNYFNSSKAYEDYKVKMHYDLYNSQYNEIKKKYECVRDDSLLIHKYEYELVVNPKDAKQKLYFDDNQFKRGNNYCVIWYAELIHSDDPSNIIKYGYDDIYTSKILRADLQKPVFNLYLDNTNDSKMFFKYKYDDYDNALKSVVFDTLEKVEVSKEDLNENSDYSKQLEVPINQGERTTISYNYYSDCDNVNNEQLTQYNFEGEKNYNWIDIVKTKMDDNDGTLKIYFDNLPNIDKTIADVAEFSLKFSSGNINKTIKYHEFDSIKIDDVYYKGVVVDLLQLAKVGLTNKDVSIQLNIKYDSGIAGYSLLNENNEISLKVLKNGLNTSYYKYNNQFEISQFIMDNIFKSVPSYSLVNDSINFKLNYNNTEFNNVFRLASGCVVSSDGDCIYPSKIVSDSVHLSNIRFESAPIVLKLVSKDISVYSGNMTFDVYGIEGLNDNRLKFTITKNGVDVTSSLSINLDKNNLSMSGLTNNEEYVLDVKYKDDNNQYVSVKCLDQNQNIVDNFQFSTPSMVEFDNIELKYNGGNSYQDHHFNAIYDINSILDLDFIQYWLCDEYGNNCVKFNLHNTDTNSKNNFDSSHNIDDFSAYYLDNGGNKKGFDVSKNYTLKITPKYKDNVPIPSVTSFYDIDTFDQLKMPVTDFTVSTIIINGNRYNRMHFFISDIDKVVINDKCLFTYYDNGVPMYEEEQNVLSEDVVFNVSSGNDKIQAEKNHKYSFSVKCDVDSLNNGVSRSITYNSKDIVLKDSNVDLGTIEIHKSQKSDSIFELRFYDSVNINELMKMNYSIYVKSGSHSFTKKNYYINDKLVLVPSGNYYKIDLPYDTAILNDTTYLFQLKFWDVNNEIVDYSTIKWNS